jgi:hypothetical protein
MHITGKQSFGFVHHPSARRRQSLISWFMCSKNSEQFFLAELASQVCIPIQASRGVLSELIATFQCSITYARQTGIA